MELLDTEVVKFQKLYKTRLGIDLDDVMARKKLAKLVRQVELVYRPITIKQFAQLHNEDEKEDENGNGKLSSAK